MTQNRHKICSMLVILALLTTMLAATQTPKAQAASVTLSVQDKWFGIQNVIADMAPHGVTVHGSWSGIPGVSQEYWIYYNNGSDTRVVGPVDCGSSGTVEMTFDINGLNPGDTVDVWLWVVYWYSGGGYDAIRVDVEDIPVEPLLLSDQDPCDTGPCLSRPTNWHPGSVAVVGLLGSDSTLFALLAKERFGLLSDNDNTIDVDYYSDGMSSYATWSKLWKVDGTWVTFRIHAKPVADFTNNPNKSDDYDYVFVSAWLKQGDYVNPSSDNCTLASSNYARQILIDNYISYSYENDNGLTAGLYVFHDSPLYSPSRLQKVVVALGHWQDDITALWGGNTVNMSDTDHPEHATNNAVVSSIDGLLWGGIDAASMAPEFGVDPDETFRLYQLLAQSQGGEPNPRVMQPFNIRREFNLGRGVYTGSTWTQPLNGGYGPVSMGVMSLANLALRYLLALEAPDPFEGIAAKNEAYQKYTVHVRTFDVLCPGDLNRDGVVNILDNSLVGIHWGEHYPPADANGDGTVNILDAVIVGSHWGNTCDY